MPDRQQGFKSLIDEFLREKEQKELLAAHKALQKAEEKHDERAMRAAQIKQEGISHKFQYPIWLQDAARRAAQLQAATHILKAVHPDARGTNIYCHLESAGRETFIGSYLLADNFIKDVAGNAAALDVYKFLCLQYEGKTLLDWLEVGDLDALNALSPDTTQSAEWGKAFCGLLRPQGKPASHTLAKQLYWLAGEDPTEDAQFHLLAPLYPSSLAHLVYQTIQEDRFGEASKQTHDAKRNNLWHNGELREYPDLAAQQFGGSKPQNVSQLNSERHGVNYLLPSLPPTWRTQPVRLPRGNSLFRTFEWRKKTRAPLYELKNFLESNPPNNQATRNKRDALLRQIIDDFMDYTLELRSLPPGWTKKTKLPREEKDWLEPDLVTSENTADLDSAIISRFAGWINDILGEKLPMSDVEYAFWGEALEDVLQEQKYEQPA